MNRQITRFLRHIIKLLYFVLISFLVWYYLIRGNTCHVKYSFDIAEKDKNEISSDDKLRSGPVLQQQNRPVYEIKNLDDLKQTPDLGTVRPMNPPAIENDLIVKSNENLGDDSKYDGENLNEIELYESDEKQSRNVTVVHQIQPPLDGPKIDRSAPGDDTVAKNLTKNIRVLCWIMTMPQNLESKAIHVKRTWGKRCSTLLFFSSVTNKTFPTIGLNVSEGRKHLTAKTMQAFRYIFHNYYDKADWFMKADDDTYVILENLRYFLSSHSPLEPVYLGHRFKQGYYSGGAGYVVSKEALKRFAEGSLDKKLCREDGGQEDVEIGYCMQKLGVKTVNTTDKLGRSRFHCFYPEMHVFGEYPDWYYHYDANGAKMGTESISDYAISFHYVLPEKMYALEFYTYRLRPYGIETGLQDLNRPHPKV